MPPGGIVVKGGSLAVPIRQGDQLPLRVVGIGDLQAAGQRQFRAQQTGITLSRSRFQELLDQLGYVYRRPKRDLGQRQDPQLREQVKAALEELKKEPQQGQSSYSLWTKPRLD